jgi:hypothetical protein
MANSLNLKTSPFCKGRKSLEEVEVIISQMLGLFSELKL